MHAGAALPRQDWLAQALCAAELGDPLEVAQFPEALPFELFAAIPELRISVPYAALRLLERFAADERVEVRAGVARALPWFADLYPAAVEGQLLPLASDPAPKVRAAVAQALADLIESSDTPDALVARWQRGNGVRQVLIRARLLLRPPPRTR